MTIPTVEELKDETQLDVAKADIGALEGHVAFQERRIKELTEANDGLVQMVEILRKESLHQEMADEERQMRIKELEGQVLALHTVVGKFVASSGPLYHHSIVGYEMAGVFKDTAPLASQLVAKIEVEALERAAKWQEIGKAQRNGELWIVSDGVYSVPAWYCAIPGEDCWYEYNRGPADGKDQYGIAPTLCKPFPKAST